MAHGKEVYEYLKLDCFCIAVRIRRPLSEHSVRVRAESVYEAALKGLKRLESVGWESDGSQIGSVLVEVWEEPTRHWVNVTKMLQWVKATNGYPRDEFRKEKLRALIK